MSIISRQTPSYKHKFVRKIILKCFGANLRTVNEVNERENVDFNTIERSILPANFESGSERDKHAEF